MVGEEIFGKDMKGGVPRDSRRRGLVDSGWKAWGGGARVGMGKEEEVVVSL